MPFLLLFFSRGPGFSSASLAWTSIGRAPSSAGGLRSEAREAKLGQVVAQNWGPIPTGWSGFGFPLKPAKKASPILRHTQMSHDVLTCDSAQKTGRHFWCFTVWMPVWHNPRFDCILRLAPGADSSSWCQSCTTQQPPVGADADRLCRAQPAYTIGKVRGSAVFAWFGYANSCAGECCGGNR